MMSGARRISFLDTQFSTTEFVANLNGTCPYVVSTVIGVSDMESYLRKVDAWVEATLHHPWGRLHKVSLGAGVENLYFFIDQDDAALFKMFWGGTYV